MRVRSQLERPSRRGWAALLAIVAWIAVPVLAGAPAWAAEPEPGQVYSEPLVVSLEDVLAAYEAVRVELAADRLEGVPASAGRLAESLEAAAGAVVDEEGETAQALVAAGGAADSLAEAEDLAAARIAFGAVSRNVLLVAARDARLTEGRHVFTCPMAEGFQRWIQPMETMANPYMGPAMLQCGSAVDWTVPERVAATRPPEPAAGQPVFEPGIPGLVMEDVRDHKFLWREIDQLQVWEHGERITVAEYRSKVVEKTAHFLGLETDELSQVAVSAVAEVQSAFERRWEPRGEDDARTASDRFADDLEGVTARLAGLLGDEPRHQLFEPEAKKWLLKLAFGPERAKEEREARSRRAERADAGGETGSP